jgi:hypothetical protein
MTTTPQKPITPAEPKRGSRSIRGWCEWRHYSIGTFYKMQREGVGPKVTRVPHAPPRISNEADAAWLKACDNLPEDKAAQVAAASDERRDRTKKSGKAAAESPKHVSNCGPRKQRETTM